MYQNPFVNQRQFQDYQQAEAGFQMKKQLAQAKIQNAMRGGDLPAPLQLANKYKELLASGDTAGANNLLMFAKAADKGIVTDGAGGYQAAPGYAEAKGNIEGIVAGSKEQGKANVQAVMEPIIAGRKSDATNRSDLDFKPKIESATEVAKANANSSISDNRALPVIDQLTQFNQNSFDMPYSDSTSGISRLIPVDSVQEKVKNLDLLKQARLDLAAPLAKQLGVNPTDKDFQASLDRIFNANASKASRQAQIDALGERIKQRQANNAIQALTGQNLDGTDADSTPPLMIKGAEAGEALFNARKAIQNGADPEAVKKRLLDNGIDPAGL